MAADVKNSLILELFEHRISKLFEKYSFDQIVHSPAAAAVGERDMRFTDLELSPSSAFNPLKKRACCE